jgi:hypothetical protein
MTELGGVFRGPEQRDRTGIGDKAQHFLRIPAGHLATSLNVDYSVDCD